MKGHVIQVNCRVLIYYYLFASHEGMFKVPVIDILLKLSQLRQVCYPSLANFLQKEKKCVRYLPQYVSFDKFQAQGIHHCKDRFWPVTCHSKAPAA